MRSEEVAHCNVSHKIGDWDVELRSQQVRRVVGRPTSTVTFHAGGVGPRTVHLRGEGGREEDQPTIYRSNCEQQARCCGGEPQPDEDGDCHFWAFVTSLILDVRNRRGEKKKRKARLFIQRPLSKADQGSKEKLEGESETHGMCGQACGLK